MPEGGLFRLMATSLGLNPAMSQNFEVLLMGADLVVSKEVDKPLVLEGDRVTFTVRVLNDGPATATNVDVSDPLPAGFDFVSANPSKGTYTRGTGRWDVGTLENGASATLTLVATVKPTTGGTTLVNVATAAALRDQHDDPSNNQASASVTVGRQTADLEVRKTASKVEVRETEEVTFTITVLNKGPDRATDVVVTEHLPPGLNLSDATPEAGAFDRNSREWRIGRLEPGSLARLRVKATVARGRAGQSLTNRAVANQLEHRQDDPANNEGSATIRALPELTAPKDHAFKTAGNTQLQGGAYSPFPGPTPAPSPEIAAVKTNSLTQDTPGLTVANTGSQVTAQGGTVIINANGTFLYTPPLGFTGGQDSFTYTMNNGLTATVTIDVLEMIWYVDNTAEGGTGQSHAPFENLWDAESASGPGHVIFVRQGDGTTNNQDSGITLKANQVLLGEGVALDVPGVGPVLEAGSAPRITNLCGYGVDLADGSEVGGIHIDAPSGRGISADGVNGSHVFAVLITDSQDHSVKILNSTGTFDFQGVDIIDSQRAGFKISNGDPTVWFVGSIVGSNQFAIEIGGTTGGTATFAGVSSDSDGSGVELSSVGGNVVVEDLTSIDSYSGVEVWGGTGTFTFNRLQVLGINGDGNDAFRVEGGSATVIANLIEGGIYTENGEAVRIQNTDPGSSVTFNSSTIEGAEGVGISLFNNQGSVTFNSDVILWSPSGDPAPPPGTPSQGVPVDATASVGGTPTGMVVIQDGSGPVTFQNLDVLAQDGQAGVVLNNHSGAVTVFDGTIDTVDGQAFWAEGASHSSNSFNFSSVQVSQGSDGGIHLSGNSGTFTFTDAIIEIEGGTGIRASSTGQVNIFGSSHVTTAGTSGTGKALEIGDASIEMNFVSLTCDTCVVGIQLDEVSGDLLIDGGTINSTSGTGVDIVDFDGNFRFDGAINNNNGLSANVQDSGPGSVQFGGLITDNGSGISLSNNSGMGIRFDGGMVLNTGPNTGFFASSGGTLDVTGTNTINTTTGTAIDLDGTTIGSTGVTFQSISSNGATNGINLDGVTGGKFVVTGTGTVGSGGLIRNTSGTGININNSTGVSLSGLDIQNVSGEGISVMNSSGASSVLVNGSNVLDPSGNGVLADASGGTLNLTLTNNTLDVAADVNVLSFSATGSSTMCLDVGGVGALQNAITVGGESWGIFLSQAAPSAVSLVDLSGTTSDESTVETFLSGRNNGVDTYVSIGTSIGAAGTSCPVP